MRKPVLILIAILLICGVYLLGHGSSALAKAPTPEPIVTLGKFLFFDIHLSANGNQSCATCHDPGVGFTGPDSQVNAGGAVYEGSILGRFGNRKPPASAYAGDSPVFHQVDGAWIGGMFWDGRATGWTLGDPLAEQAQGPFLNPLEQAIEDAQDLCIKVEQAEYAGLFEAVWGAGSLNCDTDVQGVYEKIGRSVAAYERSAEVNPFSSKFDKFWDKATGARKDVTRIKFGSTRDPYRWQAYRGLGLTDTELQGLAAFNDPNQANCAACHTLTPGPAGYPLFTDFGYENIGVPKNPANPFYSMDEWNPDGESWVDYGLGGFLKSAGYGPDVYEPEMGKHKVPTLRNVDRRPSQGFVKAYAHNGYFKSLEDIVTFYHWRAMMDGGCMGGGGGMGGGGMGGGCGGMGGGMAGMFPPPEVDQNRATLRMFSMMQKGNIVAFLKTLSDGYFTR